MIPVGSDDSRPADKQAFWRVFWGLAAVEAVALGIWYHERWVESPVGTLLIVTFAPVLILGHVNVFPAVLAAWLVRRRARRDQPAD